MGSCEGEPYHTSFTLFSNLPALLPCLILSIPKVIGHSKQIREDAASTTRLQPNRQVSSHQQEQETFLFADFGEKVKEIPSATTVEIRFLLT